MRPAKNATDRIVVWPTASGYSNSLFKRSVSVLGGVRIADATKTIHLIGEIDSV